MPTDHSPRAHATDPTARLAAQVARAQEAVRTTGRDVLVSTSERIPATDPLAVLEALAGDAAVSPLAAGLRMYWSAPHDGLALAGFGAATTLTPSGPDRFASADAAWRALLDGARVDDGAPDAGPILMGGFSFEPDGPRTPLWRGFGATRLAVPAIRVTRSPEACWLTLTTLVRAGDAPTIATSLLLQARDVVLGAPRLAADEPAHDDERAIAAHDALPAHEWRALVADAVAAIRDGAMEKVVLARAVHAELPAPADTTRLLHHLRLVHRDAYVFGVWRGDRAFVGASPERLVRLAGREVEASSLAGSARRGETQSEDAALARELSVSPKDLAEHAMVRRALGDALAELCDDVTSSEGPSLLTLPHVHHLHTAVRARLRPGGSLLDLVAALHPTPAVGGAPREPALRFIREREALDRGWYAAPVGWIGRDAGELAVALRSALVHDRDATLFAGCGIVAGSDPARELAESVLKLRPMRSALAATAGDASADDTVQLAAAADA